MHRTNRLRLLLSLSFALFSLSANAAGDGQNFWGFGPGLEVLSNAGSGTGFYIQAFGGHSFNSLVSLGLHAGYSNVGNVSVQTVDFGAFTQLTDADSGIYGRFYLDGMNASTSGGANAHGINGTQMAFAPGIGLGMMIPAAGTFHMLPEATYRLAFFQGTVNVIDITFSVMWDF
jgi:hypothetical protein